MGNSRFGWSRSHTPASGVLSTACVENKRLSLAPQLGFEPTTLRLTAEYPRPGPRTISKPPGGETASRRWSFATPADLTANGLPEAFRAARAAEALLVEALTTGTSANDLSQGTVHRWGNLAAHVSFLSGLVRLQVERSLPYYAF
jgi:hypothetical protein